MLTGAFVLTQSVGNLFWGVAADRRGFRSVFLVSLSVWVLAVLLLMGATEFRSLVVVYAALGLGVGGFQMASQNLVLEFGSREDLPMRIAVGTSMLMVGITSFTGLLGHIVAGHFEPALALALAVAGFAGGQVGPKLSVRMPRERLRQAFAVVLLMVSVWMLVGVFS